MQILLVDDDPNSIRIVRRLHAYIDEHLRVAQVVEKNALGRRLEIGDFDVVITACRLVWTDGIAVLEAVKCRFPECPVIMLVGPRDDRVLLQALKSGAFGHVEKSVDCSARLAKAVRQAVTRSSSFRSDTRLDMRLRAALNRLQIGIFRTMPDGALLEANSAFLELLGFESFEKAHEADVHGMLFRPRDQEELARRPLVRFEPETYETLVRTDDGQTRWLRVRATACTEGHGAVTIDGMIEDVSERRRAEQERKQYQDKLRSLASQFHLTEERERRRIAADLHDRIGQSLAVSRIKLGELRASLPTGEATAVLDQIRRLLDQSINDARSLMFDLSPPVLYQLGFVPAVEWLAERISEQHGIACDVHDRGSPDIEQDDVRVVLFQAVRELLINVGKHSKAKLAIVTLRNADNGIQIDVQDDGVGFDATSVETVDCRHVGIGLFSLRERLMPLCGTMEIVSNHKGTLITLRAPLTARRKRKR